MVGEGADDAGGVFDDTITEMCREVASPELGLLVRTPNGHADAGRNRDRCILNPERRAQEDMKHFWFLGE